MAPKSAYVTPRPLPAVKVGDVIRVHVPELPDLWRVDEVVLGPGTWGYLVKISRRADGTTIFRWIGPQGFEIVSGKEEI